jgi:hypothetical protein
MALKQFSVAGAQVAPRLEDAGAKLALTWTISPSSFDRKFSRSAILICGTKRRLPGIAKLSNRTIERDFGCALEAAEVQRVSGWPGSLN